MGEGTEGEVEEWKSWRMGRGAEGHCRYSKTVTHMSSEELRLPMYDLHALLLRNYWQLVAAEEESVTFSSGR